MQTWLRREHAPRASIQISTNTTPSTTSCGICAYWQAQSENFASKGKKKKKNMTVWPWQRAPLVWTEPAPGSPAAFREDEFVTLWYEMYALVFKLNFWRREDVVFPSADTGRHANLDRQRLLVEMGMSPEAVSLVERLPYPRNRSYRRMCIYFEADAMNYLDESDIKDCRDPLDMAQFSPQASSMNGRSYLLPQDVTLALPDESHGIAWILDLKYSTSRPARPPSSSFSFFVCCFGGYIYILYCCF